MDFKTLSPAYLTSLGAIFCGALLIGSSTPWVLWLGWILLIAALCLNVLAVLLSVGKAKGDPKRLRMSLAKRNPRSLSRSCRPLLVAWVCCLLVPARLAVPRSPARTFAR